MPPCDTALLLASRMTRRTLQVEYGIRDWGVGTRESGLGARESEFRVPGSEAGRGEAEIEVMVGC